MCLYYSAGRNQQPVATMASYPAGEYQHNKSSGRWLQRGGGNESGNPTTRPSERMCLYDQGSGSERVVGPADYNISNGEPGRGTQASRHPNNNTILDITPGDAPLAASSLRGARPSPRENLRTWAYGHSASEPRLSGHRRLRRPQYRRTVLVWSPVSSK